MAYVEYWRNGWLAKREMLVEVEGRDEYVIPVGPGGEVRLAVGQSAQVSGFEIRVLADSQPRSAQPATFVDAAPVPAAVEESDGDMPTVQDAERPVVESVEAPPVVAAGDPPEGIQGYEIVERISGAGAQGTVWRAVQLSTSREVALKVLKAGAFSSRREQMRFEREVELTASLDHPNIATVYDSGLDRDMYYYAMELVDGVELTEYVEENGLTRRQILELMLKVCRAVQFAHQRGIVHRDLKPSNIMVTADGEPRVLDFGLAKASRADTERGKVSIDGTIAGTPGYMSPEQAAGRGDEVDTRSDVYGLGAVLYRLLTGRLPHDLSGTQLEMLRRLAEQEVRSPREVRRDIDRELETVVMKALAHRPSERYASAGRLADDIENYLAGDPLSARRPTAVYFLRKRLRKYRLAVGVVAMVLGVLVATAVVSYVSVRGERNRAVQAERETAGQRDEARRQRVAAQGAELLSRKRLMASCVDRGWRAYERGNRAGALLWHVEALRLAGGGAEAGHRIRIGQVLRQMQVPRVLLFHEERIGHAAVSPDGTRVVTAGDDAVARVWDARTGRLMLETMRHDDGVRCAAFSGDGKRIVTAGSDGVARVWDAATGRPVTPPMRHPDEVWHASFGPAGRTVLTASRDDAARVWDAATGQPVSPAMRHEGYIRRASFSPDGKLVLTASEDGTARVWDAKTGEGVCGPMRHDGWVLDARFSADGGRVVTAGGDAAARIWDVKTGKPVAGPMAHGKSVRSASFSPDGGRVLTACGDGRARIWDTQTGKLLVSLVGHAGPVWHAAFSRDGGRVVTAGADRTARIWDAETGRGVSLPMPHSTWAQHAAFTPDGESVLTVGSAESVVRLWPARPAGPGAMVLGHAGKVLGAGLGPRGEYLVTAGADGAGRVWNADTARMVTSPLRHAGAVSFATFSPTGGEVLTVSQDGTGRVWRVATGRAVTGPLRHGKEVYHGSFSADGRRVVTAGADFTARVWDARTGAPAGPPLRHDGEVRLATFSADGRRVMTAGADGTSRVWDTATGRPAAEPLARGGSRSRTSFRFDGRRVAVAAGTTARVWDLATRRPVTPPLRHGYRILFVAFSPDGRRVVTTSDDGTAQIWDAETGRRATTPLEHPVCGPVWAAFSADGRTVATAGHDGKAARVWDANTGEPLTPPLPHERSVLHVSLGPDGRRVVTIDAEGTVRIWALPAIDQPIEHLVRIAQLLSNRKIDAAGVASPLDPAQLRKIWQTVKKRPGPWPPAD